MSTAVFGILVLLSISILIAHALDAFRRWLVRRLVTGHSPN
jgi:hypothetical protein